MGDLELDHSSLPKQKDLVVELYFPYDFLLVLKVNMTYLRSFAIQAFKIWVTWIWPCNVTQYQI